MTEGRLWRLSGVEGSTAGGSRVWAAGAHRIPRACVVLGWLASAQD